MAHSQCPAVGEQLGRFDSPTMRRWAKRVATRKARQAARRLGEDAPRKRRYSGWSD